MSEIVGFDLKPQPTTPLSIMIGYGLDKHLEKYNNAIWYMYVIHSLNGLGWKRLVLQPVKSTPLRRQWIR